jgi:nitroreductase/NAD-dependent dihydropyrimidine dehydrogenase PreA subunit
VNILEFDRQSCNQDGICAAVCPLGLIAFEKGEYPTPIVEVEELCIRCGHCVAACPTGSITHGEIPTEQCPPIRKEFHLTAEHCEHFLRSRRSIRAYKDKPVPREEISRLIEIARYAPSGHNAQCAEWLVLDSKDELRSLAGIVVDWMRWIMGNMPELASALHLERTVRRWEEGIDVILRDAPVLIVAHAKTDNRLAPSTCTIALAYLELAATSMGLGCCWAGYFGAAAATFPPMQKALSLPDGHQCFGAMMVGYPKFGYHRLPTRKAPSISWR